MPDTWKLFSKEIDGYIMPFTEVNEEYVTVKMIQKYLDQGLSVTQIALKWNQGHTGKCSSGVNSMGVAWDSCAYVAKVLVALNW